MHEIWTQVFLVNMTLDKPPHPWGKTSFEIDEYRRSQRKSYNKENIYK
jgi:hypothetical protein